MESIMHAEHTRSDSLTLLAQLKHVLLLSLFFSVLDLPAVSAIHFLLILSFFIFSHFSKFFVFLLAFFPLE